MHIIWIFTEGEGDGIESRLSSWIFFTLPQVYNQTNKQISEETQNENNDEIATEEDLHGSKASIGTTNTTISETVNCDAMPENNSI